ncbi:MAG: hypothetical protein MMC33_007711 [Icmadophila ericetorum]|nr:hypothetical protein [Icmadophila ericetorum]
MPQPIPIPNPEKPSTFFLSSGSKEVAREQTSAAREGLDSSDTSDSTDLSTPGHQTKGEAELAAEKLYEERMEDEYAKREGGA